MNTFLITPKHSLASRALLAVTEMLNASSPPKYAAVYGINLNGQSVFHCVLPTEPNDPDAVILGSWLLEYYYS